MKKLCKEERIGLRIELKKVNILILAFFLSNELFSQVPINGFCQYGSFKVEPGFNNLFSLNFNNDSYTDLVLFNTDTNKIVSIAGEKNGGFGTPRISRIPLPITNIQSLIEANKVIKRYAFTSRQARKVGIYSFTSTGRAILSGVYKFKSYPENISTADVNKNGRDEILISGIAFNGLSILYRQGTAFRERKIVDNTNFSQAVFADLNNDGYSDIAAFNALTNSLEFYYNNSEGTFYKVRTIKEDRPVSLLRSVDLNLDNYADLLFVKGNSINIIYGDFASSYKNQITLPTEYFPDQIITGDFNRDGKIDIAYINYKANVLSVIFGKTNNSFYPEMIYLLKDGLRNLIPFYSKFITGIASVSKGGELYTVTNLPSISNNVSITTGARPTAISFFDDGNNGINDICYIDSFTRSLNLIVRNTAGIPNLFYSFGLFENHSDILVDNTDPRIKIFYCFTPGKKLIEIVKEDFKTNKAEKLSIYAPGVINDLKIKRTAGSYDDIYAAYTKNRELGFCLMEYKDYRYTVSNYPNIAQGTMGPSLIIQNYAGIVYWKNTGNAANMYRIIIGNGANTSQQLYSYTNSNMSQVISFSGDLLNNDNDATVSFAETGNKNVTLVSTYKSTYLIKNKFLNSFENDSQNVQLFFGETKINGLKKIFVYVPSKKVIDRLDFINKGKELIATKVTEVSDISDFFVKNMSFRNYHLVYTNKANDCITIKLL